MRKLYGQRRGAALNPVNASYQQQLDRLLSSLTLRRELDAALAVRKEVEAVSSTGNSAVALAREPVELVEARKAYLQRREAALKPVGAAYHQQLNTLVNSLTSRRELDAALAARKNWKRSPPGLIPQVLSAGRFLAPNGHGPARAARPMFT